MGNRAQKNTSLELEKSDVDGEVKKASFVDMIFTAVKIIFSTWISMCFIWLLLIFRYSFWAQRSLLFLHFARWPIRSNLVDPNKCCGLSGAYNFYVKAKDGVQIGVWHILPVSLIDQVPEDGGSKAQFFEQSLAKEQPIVLYMHGNTGTRATFHRMELYKLLQKWNFHIVTFDYRSYGDSSDVLPDEIGVVEDGITMIKWVVARKRRVPLYVWGHSLGTGVSSHAIYDLEKEGVFVNGLILECPFNNLRDEIKFHPISTLLKYTIGFDYFFVDPIIKNGISFKTDEYLAETVVNVLIMAAEDDWIIPYSLSKKLYKYAVQHRQNDRHVVKYVQFSSKNRYGHKYICHSDELQKIIKLFTSGQFDAISPYAE